MWWSKTESEWEEKNGTKQRITRSAVRRRRRSRRKKWLKRGLAAAAVAYVGYTAFKHPTIELSKEPLSNIMANMKEAIEPLRGLHPIPFQALTSYLPLLSTQDSQKSRTLLFGGDGVGNLKETVAVHLAHAITENVLVMDCTTFSGNLKLTLVEFISKQRQPNAVVLLGIEHIPYEKGIATLEQLFERRTVQCEGRAALMTRTYIFMTTNVGGQIHSSTVEDASRTLKNNVTNWIQRDALVGRLGFQVPFV